MFTNINVTIFKGVKMSRKLIYMPARNATHYFEYVEEVGCDVTEKLAELPGIISEPMGIWLPKKYRQTGESEYVQGVEVPIDYSEHIPSCYNVIELPSMRFVQYQSPPFKDEEFMEAVQIVQDIIKSNHEDIHNSIRYQFNPLGFRGYIEVIQDK